MRRERDNLKRLTALVLMVALIMGTVPVYANETADIPLASQLTLLNQAAGGKSIRTYQGAQLTDEQINCLNASIDRIKKKKARVGFVMMNLRSGKMISYDPNATFFGASTVKGPYTIAVNRSHKKAWKKSKGLMKKAVIKSSNSAYRKLRRRYKNGCMKSLHRLSGLSVKNAKKTWPYTNPRDLAKLWCGSYTYLKSNKTTAKKLRGVFAKTKHSPINTVIAATTYSKPGWMEGRGINIYNDAGIVMSASGPYVIAVMTSLDGDDHGPVREMVRTLHAIQDTM